MFRSNKKMIVLLIMACLPIIARANWVFGMTTSDGDTIFYDKSRVTRQGDLVSVWFMTNLAEPLSLSTGISKSFVDSTQYDCVNKRSRITYMSNFSSSNAKGEILQTFDRSELSSNWNQIPPNSTADVFSNYFCKTKNIKVKN